jgi:hypothetical protein
MLAATAQTAASYITVPIHLYKDNHASLELHWKFGATTFHKEKQKLYTGEALYLLLFST